MDIQVEYKDWQEKTIEQYFSDPVVFKWQMVFDLLEGERDDCCYEICSSFWLKQQVQSGIINSNDGYKHYRLNFNELGQLDVIALHLVLRTEHLIHLSWPANPIGNFSKFKKYI